jgi:hypothetical protein
MGNSNLRAVTPRLPPLAPQDDLMLGTCGGQQQGMAAHVTFATCGLETSTTNLIVEDDKATSPDSPSTETTLSDYSPLPVHVTSLHRWIRAVDATRQPLQHPDLTEEFQAFRDEIRAELQAQARRIEGIVANSENAGEAMAAERLVLSAQVSTLKEEGALYGSYLGAFRADFDRFVATYSTLTSTFEHEVQQEAAKLLDHCLADGVLRRMEQQICTEVLSNMDEAFACEAAARRELERSIMRKFDMLRGVWDEGRDKQKPVTVDDEEDVVERASVEEAAKTQAVENDILAIDAIQFDSAAELSVSSAASSSQSVSIMGSPVPTGYEAIDESTAVPADLFESLAMAGRLARNRGQHCRIRSGGKQWLIAADFCPNACSNFAPPTCTAT